MKPLWSAVSTVKPTMNPPSLEDVLKRMVGRLCIAARGLDEALDTQLSGIQKAMRGDAEVAVLEAQLQSLSAAIFQLDHRAAAAAKPAEAKEAAPEAEPIAAASPAQAVDVPVLAEEGERIAARGVALDQAPVVEDALRDLAEQIDMPTEVLWPPVLVDLPVDDEAAAARGRATHIADAINDRLRELDQERARLDGLLQQMTTQLDAIGELMQGEASARGAAQQDRQQMDAQVRGEIDSLDTQIAQLKDLAELRRTAQSRLHAIHGHLQDFSARENSRMESADERAQHLRARIVELERETSVLQRSLKREQRLATTDALTGIGNRLAYEERIAQEFRRWKRFHRDVVLLAWDVDYFKKVNDSFGHKAGDKVLKLVGQHLARHIRATDFIARYGGEEFVMLLDGSELAAAEQLANRIRLAIAGLGMHFRGTPVSVTVSCGLTDFREGDTPNSVFERADRLLYEAKHSGRNRCVAG